MYYYPFETKNHSHEQNLDKIYENNWKNEIKNLKLLNIFLLHYIWYD